MYKFLLIIFILCFCQMSCFGSVSNPFKKDYKSQEIKYKYQVQKDDLKYKKDNRIINLSPSGYMTVDEYERQSEYKDKHTIEYDIPKIARPTDFKYIPQPLYKIVKYNDPPGSPELSLGKKLYTLRQINAQGIVSPDYTKLVYPAVYYYTDSGSVATDLFVIPLDGDDNKLSRIMKANVGKRDIDPIMSTDKEIDNYEAFRTLTPVDFSSDSVNLLVKEKLGSEQDGIWKTKVYVYNFQEKKVYDLSVILEAISYYWKEYRKVELIAKRWDIIPLGFAADNQNLVVVQAYGFTGDKPVYLGAWSIDVKANRSALISMDRNYPLSIGSYGLKLAKDGVKQYSTVKAEEKMLKSQDKVIEKQHQKKEKEDVKTIKADYKYSLKTINANFKDEYRDNKKLQSLKGSTEGRELEEAYYQYQQKRAEKDIKNYQKKIENKQKQIDKLNAKIQLKTDQTQNIIDNDLQHIYGTEPTAEQENTEQENTEQENSEQENSETDEELDMSIYVE